MRVSDSQEVHGQASIKYKGNGKHLARIGLHKTGSEAEQPNLPQTVSKAKKSET